MITDPRIRRFLTTPAICLTSLNLSVNPPSKRITPTDNDTQYYLEADYVPGQPGARTGNALNEPLNSGIATVTVDPILDIISQPSTTATIQNVNTTFTISAPAKISSCVMSAVTTLPAIIVLVGYFFLTELTNLLKWSE